jgi:uncharacterized damage-inducible protein DinB
MRKQLLFVVLLGATPLAAEAQASQAPAAPTATLNAASDALRFLQGFNRRNIIAAAEMMSETDYAFRPTPAVHSFGELVGHVADVQYLLCSTAKGEANPVAGNDKSIEKTKKTKADLVAALRASFEFCEPSYAGMTDAGLARTPAGKGATNANSLTLNVYHAGQHYGNMVTYMRMKGLVPPSSQPAGG